MKDLTLFLVSIVIFLSFGCYDNQNNELSNDFEESVSLYTQEKLKVDSLLDSLQKLVESKNEYEEFTKIKQKPLYKTMVKVLNAPGKPQSQEYVNNQVVIDTERHRYTVWVTNPYGWYPIFSVWRRPLGTTSKDVLETWSVNLDGELDFFVEPNTRHAYYEEQYYNADTEEPLSSKRGEELQKYFEQAQNEIVSLINERY